MTDIATLTLTADSSSIKAASTNLTSMTVATWNAQKGTGALAKAFAIVTGNAAASRGALDKVAVGAAAVNSTGAAAAKAVDNTSISLVKVAEEVDATVGSVQTLSKGARDAAKSLLDIGGQIANGQSPLTIAAQQGVQLGMVLSESGGAAGAISTLGEAFHALANPVTLVTVGLVAGGAALAQYLMNSATTVVKVDELTKSLAAQAASGSEVKSMIFDLNSIQTQYDATLQQTKDSHKLVSDSLVANTEEVFDAKKSLLELELKYQRALITTQEADLANIGAQFKREAAQAILVSPNLIAQGFSDPKIGDFVQRGPDHGGWETMAAYRDKSTTADEIIKKKAQLTITKNMIDDLEKAVDTPFNPNGISQPRTGSVAGGTVGGASRIASPASQPATTGTTNDPYGGIIAEASKRIAASQQEQAALSMTDEAASKMRHQTELLNEAQEKNIQLTPQQTSELGDLAGKMASTEAAIKRAQEAMDFAKDLTKGFISDLKSGLKNGESFWKSFSTAAVNALNKIADKLLNDVLDSLFKVNSAASGGGGGGFLSGLLGIFGFGGGSVVTLPTGSDIPIPIPRPTFADGGYTGPGGKHEPVGIVHAGEIVWSQKDIARAGGVGIVEAMRLGRRGYADGGVVGEGGPQLVRAQPDATVPVRRLRADNQNDASGSASGVHVTVGVSVDEDGNLKAYVKNVAQSEAQSSTRQGLNDFNQQLPDRVAQINRNPRRR